VRDAGDGSVGGELPRCPRAQAIPEPGQRYAFHGYRFRVLRRQCNQLTALRIEREDEGMEAADYFTSLHAEKSAQVSVANF
jgi:hypothetical protein